MIDKKLAQKEVEKYFFDLFPNVTNLIPREFYYYQSQFSGLWNTPHEWLLNVGGLEITCAQSEPIYKLQAHGN